MKILYYILTILITSISILSSSSYAAGILNQTNIAVESPVWNWDIPLPTINDQNTWSIIWWIISWFIAITAVLAIMSITWAAIQMVLAVGEDEKIKKARYTMIYSFIGLIVAWLAYGTVNFVVNLDLNSFL